MKMLLSLSIIAVVSASTQAMETTQQRKNTSLITIDNIEHIKKISNGKIIVINSSKRQHNTAAALVELSKSAHEQKAINAIIITPAHTRRSLPMIKTTPAPVKTKK